MIPFGGLLLLAGRMGDLLGQRRVFLVGLTIFTVASLLCAASQSQEMLVGARFIQGFGGALASAVILGMIVTMFPEPADQAKAIGVYGFVASAGGSIGLLLGGVLTDAISWHWIFLINLPIGIAVAILAQAPGRQPGRDRPQGRRRLPRCGLDHRLADARRLHDPADRKVGLDRHPHPRPQRDLGRAAGAVHLPPGDGSPTR